IKGAAQIFGRSEAADEWLAIQHTTSLRVLASFKERNPLPPWSEYAEIRIRELRAADEMRRRAAEEERLKAASIEHVAASRPKVIPSATGGDQNVVDETHSPA